SPDLPSSERLPQHSAYCRLRAPHLVEAAFELGALSPVAEGHPQAERGLLVVVVDQGLAVAGGELQVQARRAERGQKRRCPVELREAAAGIGPEGMAYQKRSDVAARSLIARDELAASEVVLDVGVVVHDDVVRDP